MTGPLVSVLVPTYNQEHSIERAVRSALSQRYDKLEVVVADDCSTDRTHEVAASIGDGRCRVVRNPRNLGRTANYRHLLEDLARGDWALMLDGDDFLVDESFVPTAIERIARDPGLVMVVGGKIESSPDGWTRELLPTTREFETLDGREFFLGWKFDSVVPHLGVLYDRRRALRLGFYDHDILSADWLSLRKLALEGRVGLLGRAVGNWTLHASNASASIDFEQHRRNLASILAPAEHARELGLPPEVVDAWRSRTLADYGFHYCGLAAAARRLDLAFRMAAHLRRTDPAGRRLLGQRLLHSPTFAVKVIGGATGLLTPIRRAWRRAHDSVHRH